MNQIEGVFRLPITIAMSISGIAVFWFGANFMSKTKIRGNDMEQKNIARMKHEEQKTAGIYIKEGELCTYIYLCGMLEGGH